VKNKLVCHVSSVHPANDVRIFRKQCVSLAAEADWDVHLVGNGPLDVADSHVKFHALSSGKPTNRLVRMIVRGWQAYSVAKALDADLYHIHDPELLPWAYVLKRSGKKVIYDSHEDVPRDILTKAWLPKVFRSSVSWMFELFENSIAKRLDYVVSATPFIRDRFARIGVKALDINNYPNFEDFKSDVQWSSKRRAICYLGAISKIRGVQEMCQAMSHVQSGARLDLCGAFENQSFKNLISALDGWKHVDDHGLVDRQRAMEILDSSMAGVVVFHECDNHIDAQPNKLFEYMGAGIPVIASDFPLWRQIVQANACGIMVYPKDTKAIAAAIDFLVSNPAEAERLGANGKRVVQQRYNWSSESRKLVALYRELIAE
jgi:glycosyltransferase involved in cell wall biosynthesis